MARARDYQPGERVPGTVYEVVRLIGAGGMGTVYDVEDTSIGKRYVLKTMHPQLGARDDLARRMQNEARTLARLNHSNIIEVITAGVTGDDLRLPYYVMERLNGQSLRVVLEKKGQLDLPHAYHIAIDLLDALDHAHDKGVIHRDVKPDNIFLHRTPGGVTVTKLLDFGIMSLLDGASRETAGRFLGTLRYAAPEQLLGDRPTPKVDLYAAGLVLYEMIAGRGPFDDEGEPRLVAAAHVEKPAPPLSRFVSVPPDLDVLVMAALAKSPDARPRDAFSFAASLRNLKRALVGGPARESTEDRATVAAGVLPGEVGAAPYVAVRQPSPNGPYVISPGHSRQAGVAQSTFHGMAPPTLGPVPAEPTGSAPTSTSAAASVDRVAITDSAPQDTSRLPAHGTEALAGEGHAMPTMSSIPAALSSSIPPFQWGGDGGSAAGDDPHVQMLSAVHRRSQRTVAPIAALIAVLGVLTVATVAVFVRHPSSIKPSQAAGPLLTVAQPRPPPVQPIPTAPPQAMTPPPPEETAAPSAASPVPPPRKTSTAPARSAATSTPSRAPSAPRRPASSDRPGPGF